MKRILKKLARRTVPLALLCAFLCVGAAAGNPFSDVRNDAPYYDAVMWVLETGVTAGTSATAFSPAATCNRGQVVTFLFRRRGERHALFQAHVPADAVSGRQRNQRPAFHAGQQV